MKLLINLAAQAVLAVLFWFAFVEKVEGAYYVSAFFIWFSLVASLVLVNSKVAIKHLQDQSWKPAIPMWGHWTIDISLLAVMVWNSHWVLGIAWLISAFANDGFVKKGRARHQSAVSLGSHRKISPGE